MRWRQSVIWRFAALVFLMQIVCVLVALWAVHQFTSRSVDEASRAVAVNLRDDIAATYAAAGLQAAGATVRSRMTADPDGSSIMLLIAPNGRRIAGNIPGWPTNVGPSENWRRIDLRRIDQRTRYPQSIGVVSTQFPDGTRLLTGHVVENDLRFGSYLEAALIGAILLAMPLAAGAAFFSAAIIRGRLRSVIDTAAAVGTGDIKRRIPLSGSGDMFDALGDEINAMLDRITGLVDEMRLVTDGLAHDLRSPLTRLRAVLDSALRQSRDEESIAALEKALDEGDTLLRMLDAALLISRAEAGIGRDNFSAVNVAALLDDFQDMYDALAEDKGVTINVDAPPGLHIRSHREILGQVLSNLIDNALKYGGDRILLSAWRDGASICVAVTDNGPGIAQEQRIEALRRFARLDASRHISGAGLGLSLASAVAHLHGGTLTLSDAGPGLRVTLTLPADHEPS
ncbi:MULTISPECIES: sensor histidine kinase [Sphingobium]|uniref:histidine kinase n=2 Tax=Sphingobium cupriresistens TaxID=1132417 RepID=A0A0J7XM78_9SPHN|nr:MULTISPECIES: HAMP domain-containing sensor histidine kinase [Sphingobium]KMS52208.1 histidine kinase [Sphingobium cupriresistens LL01]MBJ7378894.1 HAMP domain-containing histidine kinase [Sphingobium sp.]RYM09929.1 HAMP domain-containing histidine kinase [Sphingobium cupriresistens]